jgi:DnaJ-class molecular chaperone
VSAFLALLNEVQSKKCPICHGLGEYDDADFGDIACRTFKCQSCKGTGFKDGQAYQATSISGDPVRGRGEGDVSSGVAVRKVPVPFHSDTWRQK